MPATKAQVLVLGLDIRKADPRGDHEALERLAPWALRCAPVVATDLPDGVEIDSTGLTISSVASALAVEGCGY